MLIVEYLDKEGFAEARNKYGQIEPYEVKKAKPGDAGLDLAAAYHDYSIDPGKSVTIRCGVRFAIPTGMFMQVVMRSGKGVGDDLSCHIGTIDEGYRGEIMVRVRNHGETTKIIKRGERFAQCILQRYETVAVQEGDVLQDTARGATGFGSSG